MNKMNRMSFWSIVILIIFSSSIALFFINYAKGEEVKMTRGILKNNMEYKGAVLKTNLGDIELEFFGDKTPNTVVNFIKLADKGFYDGTKFHRVIKGFMIQGGDPLTKDDSMKDRWGTGGPGYAFKDEISNENSNLIGTISMANSGPNTNGSQFFINTADNTSLNTKHTVFGKVIKGMEVVKAIENVATGVQDRPVEAVILKKVILE